MARKRPLAARRIAPFLPAALLAGGVVTVASCKHADRGSRTKEDSLADAAGGDWLAFKAHKQTGVDRYIATNRIGFEWFANIPLGSDTSWGIPFMLFRLFPELDPELFGGARGLPDFGMFTNMNEDPGRPVPQGFTWAPIPMEIPDPDHPGQKKAIALDMEVRTCAACHVGRVRLDDSRKDEFYYIYGGANTSYHQHRFFGSIIKFKRKWLDDPAQRETLKAKIKTLVDSKPAGYFYQNASIAPQMLASIETKRKADPSFLAGDKSIELLGRTDAVREAAQRKVFLDNLDAILTKVVAKVDEKDKTFTRLQDSIDQSLGSKSADGKAVAPQPGMPKSPDLLGGAPGFIDSAGTAVVGLLRLEEGKNVGTKQSDMPKHNTTNDVPAVWMQQNHALFQWDGNLKGVMIRNLSAASAVVGNPAKLNLFGNVLARNFIEELPPPPYPFDVDMAGVSRGKALFTANCEGCHHPRNERAYGVDVIGTDTGRSGYATAHGVEIGIPFLKLMCPRNAPKLVFDPKVFPTFTKRSDTDPCNFRFDFERRTDVPIGENDLLTDRSDPKKQGYLAGPLDGVWATAPYLHNGSVPTLTHLLRPAMRKDAEQFVRGSLSYDKTYVGWRWNKDEFDELKGLDSMAVIYDTAVDGQSNKGHDRDVEGYRLDWSDGKYDQDVKDLIAYLKTM
jgi:mono/diheme cytochrome c family protein